MTTQEIQIRIEKKEAEIAKREKNLVKYIVSDEFTNICNRYFETGDKTELNDYRKAMHITFLPDYYSYALALQEAKATLAKYRKMLEEAQAKENTLSEMPECVIQFKNNLIERWDAYDEWKKEQIRKEYKQIEMLDMKEYREGKA